MPKEARRPLPCDTAPFDYTAFSSGGVGIAESRDAEVALVAINR